MKYVVKTKHQDGSNYVCVTADDIEPALYYAREMTQGYPLIIENVHGDEICIVFDGMIYQETVFGDAWEYAKEIEEDYE